MPKKSELDQELVTLREKLARALADYDNLEKRVMAQKKDWAWLAKVEVFDKLLPILDDLERAEAHLKNDGLGLAVGQFRSLLASEGVAQIEAAPGTNFDPEKMDCVSLVSGRKNRVVNLVQKGYELGNRVIRPAKVEVGAGPKEKNKIKVEKD